MRRITLSKSVFIVSSLFLLTPVQLVKADMNFALDSNYQALTASSQTIFNQNTDLDGFKDLSLKPAGNWWSTFFGGPGGVAAPVVENVNCAYVACVNTMQDSGDHFVRLSLGAYPYSNVWNLSELSDVRDGFRNPGDDGKFTPTVGHPVLLSTRFRFSSQYNSAGTGHVGSAGIWLWNAPINFRQVTDINGDPSTFSADAIGMTMMMANGLPWYSGLRFGDVQSNFPAFSQVNPTANLQDWNTFQMLWSVDASGANTVAYYLNGNLISTAPFKVAHNLSVEIWVDNQTINANGTISRLPVPSDEYMDVDYVVVTNL